MLKRILLLLVALVASLMLVACDGESEEAESATVDEAVAENEAEADDTSEDEAEPDEEESSEASSSEGLAALTFASPEESDYSQFETSYMYVFTPEGSDAPSLETNVVIALQQEPSAIRVENTFDSSGFGDTDAPAFSGENTTLVVDGITYNIIEPDNAPTSCFGSPESTAIMEETFRNNSFTNQLNAFDTAVTPDFSLVGTEDINGVQANHFQAEGIEYGTYTNADVNIWQQVDGGLVVKMEIVGETNDPSTGPGTQEIYYEVLSVNQPIDFTIPEICNQ